MTTRLEAAVIPHDLEAFADSLGLSVYGLRRLKIGWAKDENAWAFPMCDADGAVIGIRLRRRDGPKWAVPRSRNGLFVPSDLSGAGLLLIAEGPTDTAALLDAGFDAIGRPSCNGGTPYVQELVKKKRPNEIVIVADADDVGRDGAERLAELLVSAGQCVRVVEPPDGAKDAREWVRLGAAKEEITAAIEAVPLRKLPATFMREKEKQRP